MPRSDRLLELIQFLRTHRHPVSGARLADEFGVSLRTIYRDIQRLVARGAPIDGEAGVGYVLRPKPGNGIRGAAHWRQMQGRGIELLTMRGGEIAKCRRLTLNHGVRAGPFRRPRRVFNAVTKIAGALRGRVALGRAMSG